MKTKIEKMTLLFFTFASICVNAEEVEKYGWLNTGWSTYTYSDTANWYNGVINGVFGTNMTGKATQTIRIDEGTDLTSMKFFHSGEVTFNFVGNEGNRTVYMTEDWIQTPSTSKGSVNYGGETDGQRLTIDLGGSDVDVKISGPAVNFYGPIVNGNIFLKASTMGFKGGLGAFVDGTLVSSNAWVVLGAEGDTSAPEKRLGKFVSIGTELAVWGHKYGDSFVENIDTYIVAPRSEVGCSSIRFNPRAMSPVLRIGRLERVNNAILHVSNNNASSNVGLTDFEANSCNLLFDEAPEFPNIGVAGTTSCPMYPWLVYYHDMFYTYDDARGIRPLDLDTEVRTYSTNHVGELEASGENIKITTAATACDFTGEENVVNSIMWAGNSGASLNVTNGVLKVLSGGVLMNCLDNCTLNANLDFGDVTGYIIGRNDKSNYIKGNIAGTKGLVFATTSTGRGVNGGSVYVTATGSFTNDVYVSNAVIIQNENFFPYGERLGNTIIDGHLRLWFNTIRLNGLYGSGMVTYNNSGSAKLIMGDNDSDGDFYGRFYGNTLHVEKIGSGTQIIRRENSTSGTTTVSAGALYYDSSVKGRVVVADGATLGGKGEFNAEGTAIELEMGAALVPMSFEGEGSMAVANDISFAGANTLKLTAEIDPEVPSLNVGGSVLGADSEVDVVFEGENPGTYVLVQAATAIEPKFVSATPNFRVWKSDDGLTVYGFMRNKGTTIILK